MLLSTQLKLEIEDKFNIKFDVIPINSHDEEYIVKPVKSGENYFFLKITVNSVGRLTILCEPQSYGAYFVASLNKASLEQRSMFVNYWKELSKNLNVKVKINDSEIALEKFLEQKYEWTKFQIRITKSGIINEDSKNKNEIICKYTNLVLAMVFSLLEFKFEGKEEGKEIFIMQKRYERNPINRELCLYAKGYKCAICGFDFEEKYGSIGKKFIEVHHIVPVSKLGENYKIDPVKDLIPVCSNCHSMLHRKNPPYTPSELRKMINKESSND